MRRIGIHRFLEKTITMWSDSLTVQEVDYTNSAIAQLENFNWAKPIVNRVRERGGLKSENMPLLFEIRFAYELHLNDFSAEYEYNAGVGGSTIEFMVKNSKKWLIELLSIRATKAAKSAISKTGLIYIQKFNVKDTAQSAEAEMITAEQKIGEKVFRNKKPIKFPLPNDSFHLILADCRGYLDHGGDVYDYRQMAYGADGIPHDRSWMVHYWKIKDKYEPIKGLFEKSNLLKSAKYIQERIHFLGFITESAFCKGEIKKKAYYLANPHLFKSEKEAKEAFKTYPLSK